MLLIVPYGIEIVLNVLNICLKTLLIVPYGIEMNSFVISWTCRGVF